MRFVHTQTRTLTGGFTPVTCMSSDPVLMLFESASERGGARPAERGDEEAAETLQDPQIQRVSVMRHILAEILTSLFL